MPQSVLTWTQTNNRNWDATLGVPGDDVLFTISHYPTCYRRGPYRLIIGITAGIRHHAWGCFDGADQPMRYYHKLQNAMDEAEMIARVLIDDRNKPHQAPLAELPPPEVATEMLKLMQEDVNTYRKKLLLPEAKFLNQFDSAAEKKLFQNFGKCPYCEADADAVDYDGDRTLSCKVTCNRCGSTWVELYEFFGITGEIDKRGDHAAN